MDEANGLWCAAFVYHCVILAGFKIPVRPKESSEGAEKSAPVSYFDEIYCFFNKNTA